MSKYHYDVELKINSYKGSKDYGKPFGFQIFDRNANKIVKNYLIHEWGMIHCWSVSRKVKDWLERVAKENGC